MRPTPSLLRMTDIVKEFPGGRALDGVAFDVRPGEIHALVGENGAGKSTLANILAGRFGDYRGQVALNGRPVRITSPHHSRALGIATIFQDLNVLGYRSVAENILLGDEPAGRLPGTLNRRQLRDRAARVLRRLGFRLPLDAAVGTLGFAQQQMVAIAQAIRRDVRLLILDEPTASLGQTEVEQLFIVLCELKSRGLGMIYISHRLAELDRLCDRVTVLRDAKVVATRPIKQTSVREVTEMMLGRRLETLFPPRQSRPGDVIFRVRALTRPGEFEDVSFDLRAGEILGIAGLVGAGRTELAFGIYGEDRCEGTVELADRALTRRRPDRSVAAGLAMAPENRKTDGAILMRPVRENLTASILGRLSGPLAWLGSRRVNTRAGQMVERMQIQPRDPRRLIEHLSGGNQQKTVIGRLLATDARVLVFDEPTQGIDVGTRAQIYQLIAQLADQGRGIIVIASEPMELVGLADRILVMAHGRITHAVRPDEVDEDRLVGLCRGD